ncbi:MAG: hypothetical protein RR776_03020 [Niameybacter sp.]|uniref:hypothetical protein n=1 Tax=Niameybacter sp. TaxID=2033640 RepID=UPI002FCA2287
MGKISNFFNKRNSKTITEPAPTEKPSDPILFHPPLYTLATTLIRIPLTHETGERLNKLAYNSQLTSTQLSPIAMELENYIASYQVATSKLKDSKVLLSEHIVLCTQLLNTTFDEVPPTLESFKDTPAIDTMKQQVLFLSTCQKLLPEFFSEDSPSPLQDLFKQYTLLVSKTNSILATLDQFSPISEQLRADILSFTESVNKMQSNKSLSVDWNGQKAHFLKLREDLEKRRNAYINDETIINNTLAELYQTFIALHTHFKSLVPNVLASLTELHDHTQSDPNIANQQAQINQVIVKLLSIQTQISDYMHNL